MIKQGLDLAQKAGVDPETLAKLGKFGGGGTGSFGF